MTPRLWQQIEGTAVFAAALWAAISLGVLPVWAIVLLLFAPDLAMVGYAFGPRIGAAAYNLVHIYGFGAVIAAIGWFAMGSALWAAIGLITVAHAGLDRIFGFGLKEEAGFKHTHMGRMK